MTTTLRDIAQKLEISPALVSRVLNDKPGSWASKETRARILETAERLHYRPSSAARALVTGKTMLLAVSAADADWIHNRSGRVAETRGVIDAAAELGYRVLVLPSMAAHAKTDQFAGLVRSKGCDGFCIYAEQADAALYGFLQEYEIPFVVIGDPGLENLPRVDHDNYALYFQSVKWLAAQNRKRIVVIEPSVSEADLLQESPPFHQLQNAGYCAAMNEFCGDSEPILESSRSWTETKIVSWTREKQPEALILRGLASTLQWKFALSRAGYWPDDVLLLAHLDPTELSYLQQGALDEGLAVQIHDPHAVGQQAGELLINWINGQPAPAHPILVRGQEPRWCQTV